MRSDRGWSDGWINVDPASKTSVESAIHLALFERQGGQRVRSIDGLDAP